MYNALETIDYTTGPYISTETIQHHKSVLGHEKLKGEKDDESALSEMQRVLEKDGYMILNVTNRYALMKILSWPYIWLTKQRLSRAMLSIFKRRILGRGELSWLPDIRTHSPGKFDKKLSERGFEKIRHNYFGFSPLPSPFCPLFGGICGPMGRWMENLTRGPFGFLGGGYIVIARNSLDRNAPVISDKLPSRRDGSS